MTCMWSRWSDGNDVFDVYQAASRAIERARAGQGPTLIECKTYRWRAHTERKGQHVRLHQTAPKGHQAQRPPCARADSARAKEPGSFQLEHAKSRRGFPHEAILVRIENDGAETNSPVRLVNEGAVAVAVGPPGNHPPHHEAGDDGQDDAEQPNMR